MFRAIPTPTPKQQTTNGKIQAEKTNEKTMDVKEKSGMMAGGNLKNTPYTNSTVSTVKEMPSRSQNVEEINVIGNEVTPQRNKDSTPNMTKCAPKDQMDGKTNNGASDKAMFGVGVGVGVGVFGIHKADEITRVLNDMLQPLPSKLDRLKTSVRTVITNKDENTNRTSKKGFHYGSAVSEDGFSVIDNWMSLNELGKYVFRSCMSTQAKKKKMNYELLAGIAALLLATVNHQCVELCNSLCNEYLLRQQRHTKATATATAKLSPSPSSYYSSPSHDSNVMVFLCDWFHKPHRVLFIATTGTLNSTH
ncbi:hypothetical protein AX774_g4408 [Zancudomyces culisetae]|uniref:Uncharacterized protein n=1 Tax=Zancudomyces culisetae TaxID=1213189 RepID=A0A1R1PMG3_ZANCU|nr:hypothetical protein AX774_g4408 [Zancudomyces culisetae]|eukprot:OMH82136.1 hypothetical protein AX774_g4408 [Zancudomyces culisetae]